MYFYKIPQKVELVIKLLDIHAKKHLIFKRKHTNKVHCIIIYDMIAKKWNQWKCPERDGCVKMWYLYIMNYDSDKKNEWKTAFCNNMHGPRVDHTRWRVSGIEQKVAYDSMRWYQQINTNTAIYKAETYSRNQTINWCLTKQKAKRRDILGVQE